MTPREVAEAFVAATDHSDASEAAKLVTDDFRFLLNGWVCEGKANLEKAWRGWWAKLPNVRREVKQVLDAGDEVVFWFELSIDEIVLGGKHDSPRRIEGDWKVNTTAICTVRDGKVAEWRAYFDSPSLERIEQEAYKQAQGS